MHGQSEKKTVVTLKRTATDSSAKTLANLTANIENGICNMVTVSLVAGANLSLDNFNELLGAAILLQDDILSEVANPVPPSISNIKAINVTNASATITWITDQLSDSFVSYHVDEDVPLDMEENDTQYYNVHSITLKNLAAGTDYKYRVTSKNKHGADTTSAELTFKTLA